MAVGLLLLSEDGAALERIIDSSNQNGLPELNLLARARTAQDALGMTAKWGPDIVLLDYATPGVDSSSICRRILARHPDGKIVVLSDSIDDRGLIQALANGASGHLPLQPTLVQLQDCIQTVLNSRIYLGARRSRSGRRKAMGRPADDDRVSPSDLTPRELEVLALLADGATTRRIAEALYISEKTVETHRRHIMQKLGIHSIAGLTKFAVKHGIVRLDTD